MAGLGHKDFGAEVLTSADVDGYLMQQTRMVFATTAARDTALASVKANGMFCYVTADNTEYWYDGTSWKPFNGPLTSFTPTWGNVTLGTSPISLGYYQYVAGNIRVVATFTLGTGGSLNGNLQLTIPNSHVAVGTSLRSMGAGAAFNANSGGDSPIVPYANGTSSLIHATDRNGNIVHATEPFTWEVSDQLFLDITVLL